MRTLLLAAAAVTLAMPASAASFTYASRNNGTTVVYVIGRFEYGDEKSFAQIPAALSPVFVSFHSPGGNAYAGIQIGKIIHRRGYTTYVGAGSACESACAVAWLGGSRRAASSRATISFHAAYVGTGSEAHETGFGNAMVGAYLAELGLSSDDVIAYMTHAGPHDAQLFNFNDARQLGITVEEQEWDISAVAATSLPSQPASVPAPSVLTRSTWWTERERTPPSPERPGTVRADGAVAPLPRDNGWVDAPHGEGWLPEPQQPAYPPQGGVSTVAKNARYGEPYQPPPPIIVAPGSIWGRQCCVSIQRPMIMPRGAGPRWGYRR